MSETFLGAWLVSEYVYNPDGRFAGLIHQRRELNRLANGRIRVTQNCTPDAALQDHPMGRFAGEWVFELSSHNHVRRYHGPAVLGIGLSWGDHALTGSGVWPTFGHNFHSFAMLASPGRQFTGGKFFNAAEMIANIAGVAVPESEGRPYPEITRTAAAFEIAPIWHGRYRQIGPDGQVRHNEFGQRRYTAPGCWQDNPNTKAVLSLAKTANQHRLEATLRQTMLIGTYKTYGWMWEAELAGQEGEGLRIQEMLDADQGYLASLHHWYQDGQLRQVDVILLRPSVQK